MSISGNEHRVLSVLAEKSTAEPVDIAHLAELGIGMAEAALRSLTNKGFVQANMVRRGLSKKPDGTWSITTAGRSALGSA